ncbi:chromosomal replication initiator DnaA [Marivita sp. GX14005]|uniref:chromosomal replication initiator DnaA n=1 Tax=Marivita sp. GX14005 TaxID=2942276 RepID=UPI0020190F77|nr:chromosomal replication initiator DnaA [Marivita sp. GX14005]MCL3882410.1 chromosomal replication initiator DnaA [Marivita sp. GX14005]
MPEQMKFEIPSRPALGRGDFYVTQSNAVALALIDTWPNWPGGKLVLTGPPRSGKTHLVHVWSAESGGRKIAATDLEEAGIPDLAASDICVEDVERIAGNAEGEAALFHLHNLVLANGRTLLLTASAPPSRWGLALPDLASRMAGSTVARMAPPDDLLLSAVLAKLFADRQIVPMADVIPYLVRRMPRSFDAAGRIVEHLDREALGTPKGVTRALARKAMDALEFPEQSAPD